MGDVAPSDLLTTAVNAAREAGHLLVARIGHPQEMRFKGRRNLVTEVDVEAERLIKGSIRAEFPDHAILGEEEGGAKSSGGYGWVIDPIDGTTNFASGIPHFAVSIGLSLDNEMVLGVILNPVSEELFTAVLGRGARLNGEPIHVSEETDLRAAMVSLGLGYDDTKAVLSMDSIARLRPVIRGLRMSGCASLDLSFVACGRFEVFFHRFLKPWDVGAGQLMVTEAGGVVRDFEELDSSTNTRSVIAGSEVIVGQALQLVATAGGGA